MAKTTAPRGMKEVKKKSALPFYAAGLVWVLWALVFPFYKVSQWLLCAVVSGVLWLVLNLIFKPKVEYIPVEVSTGDEAADALIREGRGLLNEIDLLSDRIRDTQVQARIDELENTVDAILDYTESNPQSARKLRRFMNYYLPTLKSLCERYVLLQDQGQGDNVTAAMDKIGEVLITMDSAFKKQQDALFADTVVDISADITVLEQMMQAGGLTDKTEEPAEKTTFELSLDNNEILTL